MSVFKFENLEIAMHPNWGDGDTAFTLAFKSLDCVKDYESIIKRGAKPRTAPRKKLDSIGADVFGPGKIVIEFEQIVAN